jgi:hypothetical protein
VRAGGRRVLQRHLRRPPALGDDETAAATVEGAAGEWSTGKNGGSSMAAR